MTKEEFAAMLDGREYLYEITDEESKLAEKSGLVVMYGYSDDNVELRGVLDDELSAASGRTITISRSGRLLPDIEREDEEVLEKYGVLADLVAIHSIAHRIDAKWCATKEASWTFETTLPHATFNVMENGEVFCRGIVLDMNELRGL